MEENKNIPEAVSIPVNAAQVQRDDIISTVTSLMDEYVRSVELGSAPRDVSVEIIADGMFSVKSTIHFEPIES